MYREPIAALEHSLKLLDEERVLLEETVSETEERLKQLRNRQPRRAFPWKRLILVALTMVGLALLGAVAVLPCLCSPGGESREVASIVACAAGLFVTQNPAKSCPTVETLVREGYLPEPRDERGRAFQIRCSPDAVTVHSGGTDWATWAVP